MQHRGRIQAQGGGLEESESWAQTTPLSVTKALELLKKLMSKLRKEDLERRRKPFQKAAAFIEEAGKNGGVSAPVKQTFKVKGSKDERVDIEVLGGKAFVQTDQEK
jgi:hypothetical protein